MIDVMGKIMMYNTYRSVGMPKVLPMAVTLSVTDRCNSRCKTCNVWKAYIKNPGAAKEELTLEEYKRTFSSFRNLLWVTITGGEPFMRPDLKDIVVSLYGAAKPRFLTIATNGTLTKKILRDVSYIAKRCPDMKIFVNISLDGIGHDHDRIRGMKGNFKKVLKTLSELRKDKPKNVFIGINSVISRHNASNIRELYEFVANDIKPDSHIFELAERRAKLYNLKLGVRPKGNAYREALLYLISEIEKNKKTGVLDLMNKLRVSYYSSLLAGKFPHGFEGIASGYIMPRGEVWLSYSKKHVAGNLRDFDFDFKKIWFSDKANSIRKKMRGSYSTTLVNAYYVNASCNFLYAIRTILDAFEV